MDRFLQYALAGLSSGSALVVAIFTALAHVNELEGHVAYRSNIGCPEDLAGYLGAQDVAVDAERVGRERAERPDGVVVAKDLPTITGRGLVSR